jgi:hypothetical protein
MTDHIQQLFSRTGGAEALDPLLDYRIAAELQSEPQARRARRWQVALLFTQTPEDALAMQDRLHLLQTAGNKISSLNEQRKAEKAQSRYRAV